MKALIEVLWAKLFWHYVNATQSFRLFKNREVKATM